MQPNLDLVSGAFVTRSERVEKQPRNTSNNRNIGQVEDVPVKSSDVKCKEICDGSVMQAVDDVAECASDDEANTDRRQSGLQMRKPIEKCENCRQRENYKGKASPLTILFEKPIGNALIPNENQIEKRRYHDFSRLRSVKHIDHPNLMKLVGKRCRGGNA